MKMKNLQLLIVILFLVNPFGIKSQTYNGSRDVILQEDFNGWTSITSEGWFTYTDVGWNMVMASDDAINFYKQDAGNWIILISPEIDFTDATLLTFLHKSGSSLTGQKFKVGTMTDPEDPSTFEMIDIVDVTSQDWTSAETILTSVTGVKHLAFNVAASSPVGSYMWLDDVLVTDEATQANWPSFITNLNIEADAMGANSATVSWTNPSTEADGDPLTELDSVVVLRDGIWAHTVLNPVIGGNEAVVIDVPQAGLYVFTVTAYNSAGGSTPIYNDPPAWVGLDTPGAPENLTLTVVDDTIAQLSWTAPTTGAHGGYFDGVVDSYRIIRADDFEVSTDGNNLTYTEIVDIPGTYNFRVSGINSSGEGDPSYSNTGAFYFNDYLLAEAFWVSVPALGWEKQGYGNWYHWLTDYAGGADYGEMTMYPSTYFPFNGIARMVSPVLNTQDLAAVTVKFRQFQGWASGNYDFKIQTTSDGGNTWTDAWSINVNETIPPESKLIIIDNDDVGSENFQFAFVFEGNSLNLDFLAIDDIWIFESAEVDMVATGINLPEMIEPDNILIPEATAENWGYLATDFTATMSFYNENNELVYSSEIDTVIPGGGMVDLSFEGWNSVEGSYSAEFTVAAEGDSNLSNNTLTDEFDVFYLNADRTLVVCEEATGTWCGYCPSAAKGLDELVENNWPVAVVAYHKSDDYETTEGQQRIDYYGVTGYPSVVFDGVDYSVGGVGSGSMYDTYVPIVQERLNVPAPVSVTFMGMWIDDYTMHVHVMMESGSPIDGDSIVLQAALTESHIPENWADLNEVNFVERTMFHGSDGTPIDMSDQEESVWVTIELHPSWVRENSELTVFVQNNENKQIYNGNKIDLLTVSVDEKDKWVAIYPNPATDYLNISGCDNAEVNIYDIQGRKVLSDNISGNNARVDVSQLKFGIHIIELVIDGNRYTKKILINN